MLLNATEPDDSHINGLFRELIEKHNKRLFIITVDEKEIAREVRKKLRLDNNSDNVKVVLVEPNTRSINGTIWFEDVLKKL